MELPVSVKTDVVFRLEPVAGVDSRSIIIGRESKKVAVKRIAVDVVDLEVMPFSECRSNSLAIAFGGL